MKYTKLLIGIILTLCYNTIGAQSYEDAIRYSQQQYLGTARSMSMGGAFGSLGGDISAISINPAGIAVYRTSEFSFTPSIVIKSSNTNYNGLEMNDNKTNLSLNNIGFVGTYKPMRETKQGLVSSHFAISLNRNTNFNYKSSAVSPENNFSFTDVLINNANGINPGDLEYSSGITSLAYNSYLIDYDESEDAYTAFLYDIDNVDQIRQVNKNGYSNDLNLSTGFNISHFLLIGGGLNISYFKYSEDSKYTEQYSESNLEPDYDTFSSYTINNYLDAEGIGVNIKLGVIVKPIKELRVGLAYHSPTWYKIEEDYGTRIDATFFNPINDLYNHYAYENGYFDYKLNTPQKLIGSASYIFGKKAILSIDYEQVAYKNAKFRSSNIEDINILNTKNQEIKDQLTSASNIRVGGEYKLNKQISLRAGYAVQSSPYKDDPKDNKIVSLSGGIGYRNQNYFIDIAYKNSTYDSRHIWYPDFYDTSSIATVKSTDHIASVTLGWKF